MPLHAEAVEQRLLRHRPLAHHRPVSDICRNTESADTHDFKPDLFNEMGAKRTLKRPHSHSDKSANPLICNGANKARNVGMGIEKIRSTEDP